jgi:hypothetical protein
MTRAAVRRAARLGLPFFPPMERPDLEAYYQEELTRHGKTGFYMSPSRGNTMILIDPHPERAWQELGPYLLRELREYSSWKQEGVVRPGEEAVETVEELKTQARFEILTPQACRARANSGEANAVVLHPLAGGIPLARAWEILRRYAEEVLHG